MRHKELKDKVRDVGDPLAGRRAELGGKEKNRLCS